MNSFVVVILLMNVELDLYYEIFDELLHDVYVHQIEQIDDHMYHMKMVFLEKEKFIFIYLLNIVIYLQYVFEYVLLNDRILKMLEHKFYIEMVYLLYEFEYV